MRDYFHHSSPVRFVFPLDGDCLNSRDGILAGQQLQINVLVEAPAAEAITVQGIPAKKNTDGLWTAAVSVSEGRTELCVRDQAGHEDRITVFRLIGAENGFRLSVDDNILFLADLTVHPEYQSIFENPYLAVYKAAHDETGVCVHLNLFYETGDLSAFSKPRPYFNLSMMTDRFREEWRANSDWLRLSFHSRQEFPGPPYAVPEPEKIAADCALVHKEIVRFAGEETLSRTTTVHFGACPVENVRAVRELGVRCLMGLFEVSASGKPSISYFYPPELVRHIGERDFWVDTEEQMAYGRIDLILNTIPASELKTRLQQVENSAGRSGFFEFMIHEQYFYEDYCAHIPAFREMVLEACRFARSRDCKGQKISGLFNRMF